MCFKKRSEDYAEDREFASDQWAPEEEVPAAAVSVSLFVVPFQTFKWTRHHSREIISIAKDGFYENGDTELDVAPTPFELLPDHAEE
jgi:hypothetical protein